ncbi:MAG: nucleotidyltransferase [Firmicutes bacterium]|nr:nucleotidyltransferase [Bacillota bacterium]
MENNLKAVGIIAEYNPFHNGHKHHLEQTLTESGADVCVAVISGNFTQRGEIALLDKWTRAEMAVRNGVNLVVEMPTLYACSNAGYFAEAGVEILEALGAEDICFGSESGNTEELIRIAREIESNRQNLEEKIKEGVKSGFSYPRARSQAIFRLFGEDAASVIESPNNILAIEYIMRMKKAHPIAVKRMGAGYHDSEADKSGIASATAVRKMLRERQDISPVVPEFSREIIEQNRGRIADSNMLTPLIIQKVLQTSAEELNSIFGAEEGLGNILKSRVRYWKNYEDIIEDLKSKRYTRTRIERVLVHALLGIKREDMLSASKYVRVLAFDEKGSRYLKRVKKAGFCQLPIITNINRDADAFPEIAKTLEKDILAADIYNAAAGLDLYDNSEYVKKPFAAKTRP